MDLTGNAALVTGASGGIGEEFAVQLAAREVNVVLVARRADKLAGVRATLLDRHPGLRIEVIMVDLAEPGAGAELQRQVQERGISIDVLINNAGVGSHAPFVEEAPEKAAAQIQLNCGSLVDLTARFLPPMTYARHGLVINVASTAAFQPIPTMAVYGATKAFVLSFTEALWWETHASGVRVLALCPGATETEFFAAAGQQFMTRGRQTPSRSSPPHSPPSASANAMMDQHFGGSPDMIFVVHARAGTVDSPAAAAAGTQLAGKLSADPRLTGVTSAMEHPHRDRHQTGGPCRKAAPQEGDQ